MNRREFLGAAGAIAVQRKFYLGLDNPVVTVRPPYLQNVRTDRATVMWATQSPGTGYVEFSLDGVSYQRVFAQSRTFQPDSSTQLLQAFTQYTANIPRLTPNTRFAYRAFVNGELVGNQSALRTAPTTSGAFRFLVLGDSGMGTIAQSSIASLMANDPASFVIHVGDIAYDHGNYTEMQRNYFDYYRDLMSRIPFFTTPGNHEYDTPHAAAYQTLHSVPTETVPADERGLYYSYDWGNAHFVSLDSNSDPLHRNENSGLYRAMNGTGAMLDWLDRDLRSTRQFWRIVFFHHPPYAGGQNLGDPNEADVRTHIAPILEANGVQLVLSGHEHNYQRSHTLKNGTPVNPGTGTLYVTSGGGGAFLYNVASTMTQTAVQRIANHYMRMDVNGGKLSMTAVSNTNAEIDKWDIVPQPVLAPPDRAVSFNGAPSVGALIYVRGWNLALEETLVQTTPAISLVGTSLTINDRPIPLIYASPTQVVGQLPAALNSTALVEIRTPNGSTSTLVRI